MYTFESFGIELVEDRLKNGSSLFLLKKKGAPLYIRASINAGTRWNKIHGTAHFVEHMIVAGSKKFPSKNLLAEQIEKIGGEFSASTNFDFVRVNVQVAQKDDLPTAVDLLNEILCESLFDQKVIENERGAILSELRSKKSNPKLRAADLFLSLAFQGTYMEHLTLGNEESVKQISENDIKKFYADYFSPSRTTYICCGDIEIDELKGSLESSIQLPSTAENVFPPIPEIINKSRVSVEYFNEEETQLVFGFRTDVLSLEEKAALIIINNMLAVGRASILATELRYKKGLVYGVGGSIFLYYGSGTFNISTSCSEKNVQEVLDIICRELGKIYENGLNEESFLFAKKKMLKSRFIEMQTASSWVNANDQFLNSLAIKKSNTIDFMNIIEGITAKRAHEVFKKYIVPGSSLLAVCGKNGKDSLSIKY